MPVPDHDPFQPDRASARRGRSIRAMDLIAVAVAVVAGMEGALILCRAEGNSAPLETVAAELKRLLPPEVKKPAASS